MADVALNASGVSASPLDYLIPGAQEIIVRAAAATFDGGAAVGSFVPTLQVLAPDGTVLAACPASAAVAAGASVDVSWFPGVAAQPTSTAGASIGVLHDGAVIGVEPNIDFEDSASITWTLTDDPLGQVVQISGASALSVERNNVLEAVEPALDFLDSATLIWTVLDDPANGRATVEGFVQTPNVQAELLAQTSVVVGGAGGGVLATWAKASGATLLDLTTPTKPKVIADGVYAFTLWLGWDQTGGSPAASYVWNAILVTDPTGANANLAAFYGYPHTRSGLNIFQSTLTLGYTGFLAAGTVLGVFVQQFSGGNLSYGFDWPNGNGKSTLQQVA